jgi:hypothetical protein
MATNLPLTVVKRAVALSRLPVSTRPAPAAVLRVGGVDGQTIPPQPWAVLTPHKPWVKDKAYLSAANAVSFSASEQAPVLAFKPRTGDHLGSVAVSVLNSSPGRMYVIEFIGLSYSGNDFAVHLGATVHVDGGAFKLRVAITSPGTSAYCRIYVKNYGSPTALGVLIYSVKVWAVN